MLIVFFAANTKAGGQERTSKVVESTAVITIEMGRPVPLPVEGVARQLRASAAPDDSDRLLVCTFENDVEHASGPSAAYVSFDAGNSWTRTLLDHNSLWVSETSCALGEKGRAYFVASASKTTGGGMGHEAGTTEVFRSLDGGLSWTEPLRYPFIDWTSLAVERADKDGRQRVYLFGNHVAKGFGEFGEGTWANGSALLATSEDGLHYKSPEFPAAAGDLTSAFPISSLSAIDGTTLALFDRRARGAKSAECVLYARDDKGYSPVGKIELPANVRSAGFLLGQMAIDRSERFRGRLYFAFPAVEDNRYALELAVSDDGGKAWTVQGLLRGAPAVEPQERRSEFAGVAVNRDGVVGVEWLASGGCPVFAVSLDGGVSVAGTSELGNCKGREEREMLPSAVKDHLWTLNADLFRKSREEIGPGFSTFVQGAAQWNVQMTADAGGRFHVFWNELKDDGNIDLLTASATVRDSTPAMLQRIDLTGAKDVSKTTVVRIIRETFDALTASFRVDLTITTREEPTSYPSYLQVLSDHSDCGTVTYLNPYARSGSGDAIFRVVKKRGAGELLPGEQTIPIHLEVRVPGCENDRGTLMKLARKPQATGTGIFSPLSVRFRVLSTE